MKNLKVYFANSAKISYYLLTSLFLGVYLLVCVGSDDVLLYLFPRFASEIIRENLSPNRTLSIFLFAFCFWNIHIGIYELLVSLEEIAEREIKQKRLKAFLAIGIFVISCFFIKVEVLLYVSLFISLLLLYSLIGNRSIIPSIIASISWFIARYVIEYITSMGRGDILIGAGYLFFQLSLWVYIIVFSILFSTKFCKYT